jgi:hypothetical protein
MNTIEPKKHTGYFDKTHLNIEDNILFGSKNNIAKWFKNDGDFVKKGDLILSYGSTVNRSAPPVLFHYAEAEGYLSKIRTSLDFIGLRNYEAIYEIYPNDEDRIEANFNNLPEITIDEFNGTRTIKWQRVGSNDGYQKSVRTFSQDGQVALLITFNHIDQRDYFVINYESNELKLGPGDRISFLFSSQAILSYTITTPSYKAGHQFIPKLMENKFPISISELIEFEENDLMQWKINLKKSNNEIHGGRTTANYFKGSDANLRLVIRKLAKEYNLLVRKEIPDYLTVVTQPIFSGPESGKEQSCYVYLMHDLSNGFYKIGISNQPEWRERTLQSEKPTIEMLAAKKYINRKIAAAFEKALHFTYDGKRIRGEWFKLSTDEVSEIIATLSS